MEILDVMIRSNPGNSKNLRQACWVQAILGEQLDAAVADCHESLRIEPNNAEALDWRGFARFRLDEYANTTADCDAALKINAKQASSRYVRGLAKTRMGFADMRNADIAAAKTLDPKIADAYANYGVKP
jgi:tetratricopeptide (TPR) repeat protein